MLVKVQDGKTVFPYTLQQFRKENPNTSFPSKVSAETLARYNVFEVVPAEIPEHNIHSHLVVSSVEKTGGVWKQVWVIAQRPLQEATGNVRAERDRLLAETDWCALSDVVMSDEMRSYRAALRDITKQEGFPYSVSWPEKPE